MLRIRSLVLKPLESIGKVRLLYLDSQPIKIRIKSLYEINNGRQNVKEKIIQRTLLKYMHSKLRKSGIQHSCQFILITPLFQIT